MVKEDTCQGPLYRSREKPLWLFVIVFCCCCYGVSSYTSKLLSDNFPLFWAALARRAGGGAKQFVTFLLLLLPMIMAMWIYVKRAYGVPFRKYVGLSNGKYCFSVLNVLVFGLVGRVVMIIISLSFFRLPSGRSIPFSGLAMGSQASLFTHWDLWSLAEVIFLAPICEEILFRGFLMKAIKDNPWGERGVILMSAFLFSLAHIGWHNPLVLLLTFINGVLWGWIRCREESLWTCCALHMLNNFWTSFMYVFNLM